MLKKTNECVNTIKRITNFLITNYEFKCDLTYFHNNTLENVLCELSVLMWLQKANSSI